MTDSNRGWSTSGVPRSATFTIGAEASNVINVAVQLNDYAGNALAVRGAVQFYLSTSATGDNLAATAPTGGIAIGTDGVCIEAVADKAGLLVSEADGDIDINITDTGTPTFYLVLIMPDGNLSVSEAITFA